MTETVRWQEFECPVDRIDYDLLGTDMVVPGQGFRCPGCGQIHTPEEVTMQEYAGEGDEQTYPPVGTWANG